MAETGGFRQKQFAFAAYIRDPERAAQPEGIETRRMAIYRELFFNNLVTLLGGTFPVLRKLLGPEKWQALVRDFMIRHRAHTPYFLEVPREFLEHLERKRGVQAGDFPFMLELAHYEWTELALSVSEAEDDLSAVDADGNLLDGVPVKSVLAWPLCYRFPVHRISPTFLPDQPGEQATCLVIFRRQDDELEFRELNAVTARLMELIALNENDSGTALLGTLAREIGFDKAAMMQHGSGMLSKLRADGILLGTRRP
jgi:hypothetical protein